MSRECDRNLLLGVLAVQLDFVTLGNLFTAMQAWTSAKHKSLAEVLIERGDLALSERSLLEPLIDEHVRRHGDDPAASLAALSSSQEVISNLRALPDSDVAASVAKVGRREQLDPSQTPTVDSSQMGGSSSANAFAAILSPQSGDSADGKPLVGGRFRILRPHARGGLGEVFVAMDELHREVAFKEIRGDHSSDPDLRQRFVVEAEVTGSLEHPGIVPVYGLGHYPDGRPFYAMRFVRGDSLATALRRYHARRQQLPLTDRQVAETLPYSDDVGEAGVTDASGDNDRPLTASHAATESELQRAFRALLRRFVDVCNAIEYAHHRGVLHRDLKPGNIMLGKYGETLVVDWGLAKPLGRKRTVSESDEGGSPGELSLSVPGRSSLEETSTGRVVGTPQFMSPEQAAGQLDRLGATSDVYSLGATLFQILTGRQPIAADLVSDEQQRLPIADILGRIQHGDFPRPREIRPDVPIALESVCLKAMAREPGDRYATARELAEEIERWLADEPVTVGVEPLRIRTRRWVRRHQSLVAATSAAVMVTLVALLASLAVMASKNRLLEQANSAERRATARAQEQTRAATDARLAEAAAKRLAQSNAEDARRQSRLALQTLHDLIFELQTELADTPGTHELRKRLLEKAVERLKEVSVTPESWLDISRNTAFAQIHLGDIILQLGADAGADRVKLAESYFHRAHSILSQLLVLKPQDQQAQQDTYEVLERLGEAHMLLDRPAEALQDFRGARNWRRPAYYLLQPRDPVVRAGFSKSCGLFGDALWRTGDVTLAIEEYQEKLRIDSELVRENPNHAGYQRSLANAHERLGNMHQEMGDLSQAQKSFQEAVTLRTQWLERNPRGVLSRQEFVSSAIQLAVTTMQMGDLPDAGLLCRRAQAIAESLVADDPKDVRSQRCLAGTHDALSHLAYLSNDFPKAISSSQSAVNLFRQLTSLSHDDVQFHKELSIALLRAAEAQSGLRDYQSAATTLEERLVIADKLRALAPDNSEFERLRADTLIALSRMEMMAGNPESASRHLEESVEITKRLVATFGDIDRLQHDLALSHGQRAAAFLLSRDFRSARREFQIVRATGEKMAMTHPKDLRPQRELLLAHIGLAMASRGELDFVSAIRHAEEGLQIIQLFRQTTNLAALEMHRPALNEQITISRAALRAIESLDEALDNPRPLTSELLLIRVQVLTSRAQSADLQKPQVIQELLQAAAKTAETLRRLTPPTANDIYNAACGYALAATAIDTATKDQPLSDASQSEFATLRATYIRHALACLSEALKAGFQQSNLLKTDPDLRVLHDLPEFQKLLRPQ